MSDQKTKLLAEELICLKTACQEIGSLLPGNQRPHLATLHRWCNRGIRGSKLESLRVGAKVFTSRQALTRFINRTSG